MRIRNILICLSVILAGGQELVAQDYNFFERITNRRDSPEQVMEAVGVRTGMIIGEIGAGWGRYTTALAYRVGPEGKVFAGDINPARLDFIRYRCERQNIQNVETILGKTDDPRYPHQPLDMVFIIDTYHALEQFTAILLNVKPLLKPGAKIVIVHLFDDSEFARLGRETKEAGFTCERLGNLGFLRFGWELVVLKAAPK